MKIDLYVKVCLTVIAVSLGTQAFKDFAKPAYAELYSNDLNMVEEILLKIKSEIVYLGGNTFSSSSLDDINKTLESIDKEIEELNSSINKIACAGYSCASLYDINKTLKSIK